jgi:dolichol-phosphate mannosyltransferase
MNTPRRDLLSVITPAFNETDNLPVMRERLASVLDAAGIAWEWIIVDDHSADATFAVAQGFAKQDKRIRCFRLARNSGSHAACACGLFHCDGDAAVIMAVDLQDPPEAIPLLLDAWRKGAQVVSAVRGRREGETKFNLVSARLFYWMARRVFGLSWWPATGADFVLVDRRVVQAFREQNERNFHLFALINWMGFRQAAVVYDKQPRLYGKSGWSFTRRIKLALDMILSFSYRPVRFMSLFGVAVALLGVLYALFIIVYGSAPEMRGWASLMVVTLIIGGTIMTMLGLLGEYLWRTYEEARGRPLFLIEAETGESDKPSDG